MIAIQEHLDAAGEHSTDAAALGLVPPPDLAVQFGGGDFLRIGRNLLQRLVDWCGLLPSERVLDAGCGAGRAAVPLTGYLGSLGCYEGFDVYPLGVQWCRTHLTPIFPNFRFQVVDVYNALYNPAGTVHARDFRFPFQDASFDLALLNSVFTHMLPEDVLGYVGELARVLDRGGRAYVTWFLLDEQSLRIGPERTVGVRMAHRCGPCYLQNRADPEEAVGYARGFVLDLFRNAGLEVVDVRPGAWRGIKSGHYQDVTVVRVAN
ncbi:MAG: class I SAM-dependent methyltransferase [Desulfovibrio sp.]|jgi:SAM-dependent methyltransferase